MAECKQCENEFELSEMCGDKCVACEKDHVVTDNSKVNAALIEENKTLKGAVAYWKSKFEKYEQLWVDHKEKVKESFRSPWISIKDKAPKEGQDLLVKDDDGHYHLCTYHLCTYHFEDGDHQFLDESYFCWFCELGDELVWMEIPE